MFSTGINARYTGSGLRSGARSARSERTARSGGWGSRHDRSDAGSLHSAADVRPAGGGGLRRNNPMAGPDDGSDVSDGPEQVATFNDMPWLYQLQRYSVLSSAEAEATLLACLRNISTLISDLFQVETEMATQPTKRLTHSILSNAVTTLIPILVALPDSAYVDEDGVPDESFNNVVRGLCHLWSSLDVAQLSSVTRLVSLTHPAEAVSQVASHARIVLPTRQRLARDLLWSANPARLFMVGFVAITAGVVGTIIHPAAAFGVLPPAASFAAFGLQAAAFTMLIVLTVIHGANRSADGAMRTTVCNSVTAGLAKVTTAGVGESAAGMGGLGGLGGGGGGGGGPGTDALSLAGLGGKAGPGQAASIATGHNVRPSAMHVKDGNGVGGDASNDWYAPPPHIQYRYPDGVLMVPAGLNESWVCIDARPLNKHAMIIALNTDRRVSIWNSSAAEATGFSADTRIDKLAKECLTAPGDTLFRLPRMVGDHAVLELHNVVTANTSLPFVVGDVRDLAGEPAGHCFVAPAIRDDLTSMRSFLHEYLQHEMWEGLAYCDAVAKQLKDLVARTEGTVTLGLLDADALKASSGRSRNSNQGTPSSALRPALDADNRRISSSSSQKSDPTHKRQSSGARGPSSSSGGEQMQLMGDSHEGFAADDWAMQLAADMQLLQTSIQREVAKMRLGVRLMGWDTLNTTARLCSTEWEWTNGERLLGAAARYHFAKASVGVETNVPPSFRLPASAARIIKAIINFAPAHCSVFLQHSQRSKRVGRVTVTVTLVSTDKNNNGMGVMSGLGEKSHGGLESSGRGNSMARSSVTLEHLRHSRAAVRERFDFDVLTAQVGREVFECCATVQMFSDDTAVSVHFPCVRDAVEDPTNDPQKTPGGGLKPQSPGITSSGNTLLPTVATYCDCVVAVCLAQPMDQHNLGMMLLGITGVSLTICRDVADLQQRLSTVDMVIIANAYRARIEVDEDFDAVVIPVVDQDAPYQADASFLRLPLQREDVFKLIVDASEVVAENKRAHEEAKEREAILQTRHDATWTKGALLGRGTFGVCYSATNDVTGGIMAVKQFEFVPRRAHGNVEDADAERERFMTSLVNEIRILTKLDHPNIVHYFHCERTDGGVNLFMELCEGSLHDVIRKHRTRDTSALYHKALPVILQQTLLAVAYLHNLSIIHRDLKPQNILTKGDRIKLTDFGTAHQVSQDETLHDTQGTLRFMAPEVYQAQSYNWSCDVWSIGCIVCEMLDVRVPFMNPGQHHMLGDIQQADTVVDQTLAGHVSDEARDFINLCLQVKPELRPSVSTLLLHPLVETHGSPFRLTTLMGGRPAPLSQPVVQQPSDVVGDAEAPNEDEMLPPAVVADFEGDGFSLDSQA